MPYVYQATSLPGHLLHYVVQGEVEQTSNGRRQRLIPGTVIWYHEDEWVEGRVLRSPWIYFSVNFSAPTLAPPDFEARLQIGRHDLADLFAALHTAWCAPSNAARDYTSHARLLDLLAALQGDTALRPATATGGRLWWEVETWCRRHISRRLTLTEFCTQFHRSPNTLTRACLEAVGQTPMRRLKQIRLSLARGLVHYSDLNMTEIALRIGYARVHEFSRDYRKAHGRPPTTDRAGFPG
jgi:AraC-like DNA-binding protein